MLPCAHPSVSSLPCVVSFVSLYQNLLRSHPCFVLSPSCCSHLPDVVQKCSLGLYDLVLCVVMLCNWVLVCRGALFRVLVFTMTLEHRFRRLLEVSQHRTHRHEWSQCSMPHACFLAGQLLKQGSFNSGFCGLFDFT